MPTDKLGHNELREQSNKLLKNVLAASAIAQAQIVGILSGGFCARGDAESSRAAYERYTIELNLASDHLAAAASLVELARCKYRAARDAFTEAHHAD